MDRLVGASGRVPLPLDPNRGREAPVASAYRTNAAVASTSIGMNVLDTLAVSLRRVWRWKLVLAGSHLLFSQPLLGMNRRLGFLGVTRGEAWLDGDTLLFRLSFDRYVATLLLLSTIAAWGRGALIGPVGALWIVHLAQMTRARRVFRRMIEQAIAEATAPPARVDDAAPAIRRRRRGANAALSGTRS